MNHPVGNSQQSLQGGGCGCSPLLQVELSRFPYKGKSNSEAVAEHFHHACGFTHRVEVDGGNAFVQEAAALGGAPFDPDAADGFPVVPGLPDGLGELHGKVDGEGFRQQLHLAGRGEGLEARDDGNGDAGVPAAVHETEEDVVVEEHLGDDAVRARSGDEKRVLIG